MHPVIHVHRVMRADVVVLIAANPASRAYHAPW